MAQQNQDDVRIGNTEREAATKALDAHLSAGRIDMDEYGERYAKASMARTRGELEPLFADLPEPHALTLLPAPPAPPRPREPLASRFAPWRLAPLIFPLALILTIAWPTWGWIAWIALPALMGAMFGGSWKHDGRHPRNRSYYGGSCGSRR